MPLQPDIAQAMLDPAGQFGHPRELLARADIDDTTKRKILKRWELDARELETAESENMAGGEPNLLHEVREAMAALKRN